MARAEVDLARPLTYPCAMAVRKILTVPNPILKRVSAPVQAVTDETRALMDDMLETMYAANGIGLAAIQIGVAQRVIVMDLVGRQAEEEAAAQKAESEKADKKSVPPISVSPEPRYFVNPELVWRSEEMAVYAEGCLSVPGFFEEVERPARCRVRYLDYHGGLQEEDCSGLLATCIQHELDHVNGILFLDHLSRLKRDYILKKLRKQAPVQPAA